MATNLSIENLSRVVETGDADALMGGGGISRPGGMSEARIVREMQANGMDVPSPNSAAASGPVGDGKGFGSLLKESFDKVNQDQTEADRAIKELVAGRSKNIHETLLTIERADASLKMAMQVRNKILDAYKEIMRMQV